MKDWRPLIELPDLRRVGIIALDLETHDKRLNAKLGSGWPFGDGHICGVSVAYRADGNTQAHYIPLHHPDSDNFDPARAYAWLGDLIRSNVSIATLNGGYDWGWLRTEADIKMPPAERLEEIGALATIVDENRYTYNLDDLCKWRGLPGKDTAQLKEAAIALGMPKRGKPQSYIWKMPARVVGPYAEQDPISTLALFESLDPMLDQENTRAAYRLEVELLPMVLEMRRRGIRIDVDAAEQARDHLLAKRDAVFDEISDKLGINVGMTEIGRNKWLAETFDRLNIKFPRTEKGNPSFTAGNSGWMPRHKHWLPPLIVKADRYNNAAANFLQHYILDHAVDGRVHAEIHPHRSDEGGTRSLRFSYSDPPLQLMPAHDEELTALIRGVFLPEEGEVWTKPDISQQEFRFIVHYAARHKLRGAQQAVERYRADPDTDFHAFVAELTGIERKSAKAANFAKAFGAGVRKFAAMINQREGDARAIYETYDRALPFVHLLSKVCMRTARRQGYLELYDGARRHWSDWVARANWTKGTGPCPREEAERRINDPDHPWYRKGPLHRADVHKAMNALIQGSAARHTKLWMRAVWREGIIPLLQMHDALECSVSSPEQAEHVALLGCEAVELEVPIRVDLKYGRNWGDAKHTWEELQQGKPARKKLSESTAERKNQNEKAIPQSVPPAHVNGHTVAAPTASSKLIVPDQQEPETLDQRLAPIPLADLIGEQPINGKIACPFHEDDTPSLHVYRDHYYCFGCGAHGGHLDWLREVEGLSDDAAVDVIFNWQGRTTSPRQENDARTLKLALALWQTAKPIAGTLAVDYLADVRGSDVDMLPAEVPLRFHPRCTFGAGQRLPSLLALYQDVESDEPAGIHRIALTADVMAGGKVERRSLGHWPRPRAIKLWPAATILYVGEGIETVLAAATRLPYRDGALMRPAWAAVSAGGISKFPVLPDVQELRLLLDHDDAGAACAVPCRERWEAAGRKVTRLRPPQPGYDFNDVVLERLLAAS
jgi:DNA polymerase I-like protein with 3'-5' exonuclease and polymerase domains